MFNYTKFSEAIFPIWDSLAQNITPLSLDNIISLYDLLTLKTNDPDTLIRELINQLREAPFIAFNGICRDIKDLFIKLKSQRNDHLAQYYNDIKAVLMHNVNKTSDNQVLFRGINVRYYLFEYAKATEADYQNIKNCSFQSLRNIINSLIDKKIENQQEIVDKKLYDLIGVLDFLSYFSHIQVEGKELLPLSLKELINEKTYNSLIEKLNIMENPTAKDIIFLFNSLYK